MYYGLMEGLDRSIFIERGVVSTLQIKASATDIVLFHNRALTRIPDQFGDLISDVLSQNPEYHDIESVSLIRNFRKSREKDSFVDEGEDFGSEFPFGSKLPKEESEYSTENCPGANKIFNGFLS